MIIYTFYQTVKIINMYKNTCFDIKYLFVILQLPIFLFNWNFIDGNYKIFSFYGVIFSSISIRIKIIALLMEMQL
jgi:hypothetical protein